MLEFLGFIAITVIAIAVVRNVQSKEYRKKCDVALQALPARALQHVHYAPDNTTALAIDPSASVLYFISAEGAGATYTEIAASAILSAELFEDGDTILSKSGSRTIGGALIGGALLGGAGAVVGGLSGKQRSRQNISKIELRIAVNDMTRPTIGIAFLTTESSKSSNLYIAASQAARDWHARISILIQRAEGMPSTTPSRHFITTSTTNPDPPKVRPEMAAKLARARELAAQRAPSTDGEHRLDIE